MKIIIGPCVCGFTLNRAAVEDLFVRRPELFDEPLPAESFRLSGQSDAELLDYYWNAVLRDGQLHFLIESPEVRTDPILVARLEREGSAALIGPMARLLKVVEVPDDVQWYLFEDDSGAESVHERHRVWS